MPKVPDKSSEKKLTEINSEKLTENSTNATNNENENNSSQLQTPSRLSKVVKKYGKLGLLGLVAGIVLALYQIWLVYYPPKIMPPSISKRQFVVLVPLASTSSEYNGFIDKKEGTYDKIYSNQASQNIRDVVKVAKAQWFNDNKNSSLKEEEIDFFCFPEGFDGDPDSYKKAFEKAVEIVKGKGGEIIGLLGNVSSTSTLKYGEFCGLKAKRVNNINPSTNKSEALNTERSPSSETKNPKTIDETGIPMILPLATATSLMKNLELAEVPAVLRLPPANDKQAENISNFLLKNNIYTSVILKDLTNETYSSDLIENFREFYVQKQLSNKKSDFGEIIATIPISGKETSPFLYSELSNESTGLVIAGMTNSAIETLAQANASKSNFKSVILTDGAVDEYLGKRIKKIQNEKNLSNLYLSFPSPCALDKALEGYLSNEKSVKFNKNEFQFTHSLYVADGVYIIISALNTELSKNTDKLGSSIIIDFIKDLKKKAIEIEDNFRNTHNKDFTEDVVPKSASINIKLPFQDINSREYLIDKSGNNTNANYFLFKLDNNSNWNPVELNQNTKKNCASIQSN